MSSVSYGNGTVPSNDDPSVGGIIQHPYLTPNTYAVATATVSPSSLGQYQHYYGHALPPQPLLHNQQVSPFYPSTTLNHLPQQGDFSNSSSSIASSSSSIESSRKPAGRKRATDKSTTSNKSNLKRKAPTNEDDNDLDDDDDEENKYYLRGTSMSNVMMSTNPTNPNGGTPGDEDKEKQARENHCEIERRRRVKMATYFAELCDMVPSCSNLARKPDKLTILRMAAQFMKNLRTTNNSLTLSSASVPQQPELHKPSFLNDQELKYLMVESCDAFLFALNCDNLRVMYVSDAIQQILSYTCQDWYSRVFYDFLHPDDVEKLREQLNLQAQDGNSTGSARILDLKTGTVKKDGHTSSTRLLSSKRSFICRLRVGSANPFEQAHSTSFVSPNALRRRHRTPLGPSNDGQLYEVVHINGYIRNLNLHHPHDTINHHPSSSNSSGQMAFVAIARVQNSSIPNINDLANGTISTFNTSASEFTCRCHWETGEILFVDQRCTPMIGYQSQDLLHKIIYEQLHPDDQLKFQDLYKRTVTQKTLTNTSHVILRFRTNIDNEYISLKTSTYAFCNPCTDDIEFVIVTFLSNSPNNNNKTSVIANTNDYTQQTYENYARATTNPIARYPSQSPGTYPNTDAPNYPTGNESDDQRTFASNNGGSTWAAANENWSAVASANNSNTDYTDPQANLAIYHQYQA